MSILRTGLVLLAVIQGVVGAWALAALLGYLTFTVPHFVFHLGHLEHMPIADQVAQTVTLLLSVVVPLGLLALTRSAADDVIPTATT